jgi:hypothetical protein
MLTHANHTQPRRREVMLFTLKIKSGKNKTLHLSNHTLHCCHPHRDGSPALESYSCPQNPHFMDSDAQTVILVSLDLCLRATRTM